MEEIVFFLKLFFIKFYFFFQTYYFSFLQKRSIQRKKTFEWNNIIWYAFYSKYPTFNDFVSKLHVFLEKKIFFWKETQKLNVLTNLTISIAV